MNAQLNLHQKLISELERGKNQRQSISRLEVIIISSILKVLS